MSDVARPDAFLPDIKARIDADFEPAERALVRTALEDLRNDIPEPDRVARCILFTADGEIERFADLVRLARIDYRDVIVAGEYDRDFKQLRDLSKPFD